MTHSLIERTIAFVKKTLADAEGGHDWWHIRRVWQNAKAIAAAEDVDPLVVELAALLHDIADSKFHQGDEEIGPRVARDFLETLPLNPDMREHVEQIVRHVSWKGGKQANFHSPELAVVQDADRLDAIGAIGIARAFNFGGYKGRPFYDPEVPPNLDMSPEEYKQRNSPTINHFYEKLLLLKDRMHTATGRAMAEERHRFMEIYLEQFYREWNAGTTPNQQS